MVGIIPLTNGRRALVSDKDYDKLKQYNWIAYSNKYTSTYYAISIKKIPGTNKNKRTYMHRLIMERILEEEGNFDLLEKFKKHPRTHIIDHKSGHGLDNTRSNLRIVTHRQNNQNRHNKKSSKYPGVCWEKSRNKWKARIYIDGHRKHLGYFESEKKAFIAYKKAVHELVNEKVICELEDTVDGIIGGVV